ncbi:5-oxoprolinase subunit PxpB [Pontibacterium granulatum]|uniref:5-oxoprolinase subunit PxpB n=1 Tax=Pontibacterium granulatum TaxID=2036029 RepID=UPI00249A8B1A|nr:5-oxoprolinase subunit PxpB [Pontibacterium granulatum]MDI3324417.1 5-oxoprolinase subunit PxpB [Pontibacterium granulatum]
MKAIDVNGSGEQDGFPYELRTAAVDALIVYLGDKPSEKLTCQIRHCVDQVRQQLTEGIVELVPAYTSILIQYDLRTISEVELRQRLSLLLDQCDMGEAEQVPRQRIVLPVCYDVSLAPDLMRLSEVKQLSPDEIVTIHSDKCYQVFAVGFSPGFAYLGELDTRLQVSRLDTPRTTVPAGSVAVANRSTTVYPQMTPGGWWLIGRCPLPMFDKSRTPQSLIQVGDEVIFQPLSLDEYKNWRAESCSRG